MEGYKTTIVNPEACLHFCKVRSLPYFARAKVKKELNRLQAGSIIEPVQFTDWAVPIDPVLKRDGKSICICGEIKMTLISASKVNHYSITKIDNLF